MYAPFGVVEKPGADILPPTDKGRFTVTKTASDEYVFKVPTLRNIRLTAPYFHSGQAWDLGQAVAVMGASQLGTPLSADEVSKITAFLDGLTGDQPKVTYPELRRSHNLDRLLTSSFRVRDGSLAGLYGRGTGSDWRREHSCEIYLTRREPGV